MQGMLKCTCIGREGGRGERVCEHAVTCWQHCISRQKPAKVQLQKGVIGAVAHALLLPLHEFALKLRQALHSTQLR